MKCFYHPTVDAVATCKSCCRGLCADCIAEVGRSCSCRNRCEADVAILDDLAARGSTVYQKTSANYLRSGLFTCLAGALFVAVGALIVTRGEGGEWGYFLVALGILYAGWGASHLSSAKRMNQK